jgi:hypothetical protein
MKTLEKLLHRFFGAHDFLCLYQNGIKINTENGYVKLLNHEVKSYDFVKSQIYYKNERINKITLRVHLSEL